MQSIILFLKYQNNQRIVVTNIFSSYLIKVVLTIHEVNTSLYHFQFYNRLKKLGIKLLLL